MRVIVITGTTSGLGKAFLSIFHGTENYVISISRRSIPEQVQMDNVTYIIHDLSEPCELIENCRFSEILPNGTSEICFINNAAIIGQLGEIGTLSQDCILRAFNINVISPILISNELARISRQLSCQFKVLHIGTGAADRAIAGLGLYCSSKSAIDMFYQVASAEGLDAFSVDPGVLDTAMQREIRDNYNPAFPMYEYFVNLKERGELKNPHDVARDLLMRYRLL
jgi:benzil reductase ((S)-benzoin forming)